MVKSTVSKFGPTFPSAPAAFKVWQAEHAAISLKISRPFANLDSSANKVWQNKIKVIK